jgi:phosphatidylinositol alpha-1,6-mannosyltransferase
MRILMLDNEFPPLGGGTGVVNYHLLKELARYPEITVDLVTSSRTRECYERERFAERITIYKVPVDNRNIHHSTNVELLRYTWRGLALCRKLLRAAPYDLSFAFAGVPAGAMSYALRLRWGLPYIVSLQGPDVPGFEARYNYLYPALKPLLRRVWRDAHAVLAISREHRELARRTLPGLAIPIIYNGVETDVFAPRREASAALRLLCVGRLIERKGQQHLLRAFAQLCARFPGQGLQLSLVGTGDNEQPLRRLAAELGVAGRVDFTGFVDRDGMPAVYNRADIFVLPSESEGMSIALLEAMASGLPVVVTATGGTDELVTPELNGLVVPWADVGRLAEALARLVAQPELRAAMGERSRERARAFAWDEIARQYVELMSAAAYAPRRGRVPRGYRLGR